MHLQEYLLTLWPSSKKDLGSKGSVPAVELIPAVEENVGEGKGEEKHLEVGSWQLSSQFQGAAPGEETALRKTDRRVCSEGCKGEFLNAKENRGEKKEKWILQEITASGERQAAAFQGWAPWSMFWCSGILHSIPGLHTALGMWAWHGMASHSSSHFVCFWSHLTASPSSFYDVEPTVRGIKGKKRKEGGK